MNGDDNAAMWWAVLARAQEDLERACRDLLELDGLSARSQAQLRLALQANSEARNLQ